GGRAGAEGSGCLQAARECAGGAGSLTRGAEVDPHSRCAAECLRQRSYFYGRAAIVCPTSARAHVALAEVYAAAGRLREASASFERAVVVDPASTRALVGLGDVALLEERYPRAIELYGHALAASADDPRAGCGLALARRLVAHEVVDRGEIARCLAAGVEARGVRAVVGTEARLAARVLFAEGSADLDEHAQRQLDEIGA